MAIPGAIAGLGVGRGAATVDAEAPSKGDDSAVEDPVTVLAGLGRHYAPE